MEDNQGNVWVGAYQTGIMVIPKSMYGFEYISLGLGKDAGQAGAACVTSIAEDLKNECLWIGTDGMGLFRVEKDGTTRLFSSANSELSNNSIMSIVQDKRGTLWPDQLVASDRIQTIP